MELHPTNSDTNQETNSKYPPFSFKIVGNSERIDKGQVVTKENIGNTRTGAEPNPIGKYSKRKQISNENCQRGVHSRDML